MTNAEWLAAADPNQMINLLETQGYGELLWDFTIACCRRIWNELPGEAFRRLVVHVEQVGIRGIEDPIHEASQACEKLERRIRKAANNSEESNLNRQLGYGNMMLAAFDQQDGASSARSISNHLLEWAADPGMEAKLQADSLRQLVPDASQRVQWSED